MANTQDFTAFFKDLPFSAPVDEAAIKDAFAKAAKFNEQLAGVALDAANKTASVTSTAADEVVAGLRGVTKARTEVTDYASALVDFGNAQAELLRKNAEALTNIAKQAQSEATELFVAAGKDNADAANETVNKARARATTTVRKAANAA